MAVKLNKRRYLVPRTQHEAPTGCQMVKPERFNELRAVLRLQGFRSTEGRNLWRYYTDPGERRNNCRWWGSRERVFVFSSDGIFLILRTLK